MNPSSKMTIVSVTSEGDIFIDWDAVETVVNASQAAISAGSAGNTAPNSAGHLGEDSGITLATLLLFARNEERVRCLDLCKVVQEQVIAGIQEEGGAEDNQDDVAGTCQTIVYYIASGVDPDDLIDGAPAGETLQ